MELSVLTIQSKIHEIRGLKVMLDFDLAEMYEVETKRLKEAVKRNAKRFPHDFMFILTQKEAEQGICLTLLLNKVSVCFPAY